MAGVFPNETYIYIVNANTNGSALATSDMVVGEIRDFKISGLEQENDYKNLFGGQLEIEKPRGNGEVSFSISVSNTAVSTLDRWDNYKFPTGKSSDETANKAIFISHLSNGLWKTVAVNNARITTLDTEMNADEELMKSVTFKFAATTPLGVSNLKTSSVQYTNAFFNW